MTEGYQPSGSVELSYACKWWNGWDLNPQSADYESEALTIKLPFLLYGGSGRTRTDDLAGFNRALLPNTELRIRVLI